MALKQRVKRKNTSEAARRWLQFSKLARMGRLSEKEIKELGKQVSTRKPGAYEES